MTICWYCFTYYECMAWFYSDFLSSLHTMFMASIHIISFIQIKLNHPLNWDYCLTTQRSWFFYRIRVYSRCTKKENVVKKMNQLNTISWWRVLAYIYNISAYKHIQKLLKIHIKQNAGISWPPRIYRIYIYAI